MTRRLSSRVARVSDGAVLERCAFEELVDSSVAGGDRNATQLVRQGRVLSRSSSPRFEVGDVVEIHGERWQVQASIAYRRPESDRVVGQVLHVSRRTPGRKGGAA